MTHRKHHRLTPRLFVIVGALVFTNFLFAPHANALSLTTNVSSKLNVFLDSPLKENDEKLKQLQNQYNLKQESLADKQKKVDAAKQETSTILSAKETIEKQIEDLKAEVAELGDMFVHINLYAPDSAGNLYAAGNCTWYAKSRRPDLPNNLGNANTWYYNAAAAGFGTGTKAKVGAVATTTEGPLGHVAYVEKVSRDGMWVTISEMNYGGLYVMNTRTVPYSNFLYIYEKN